MKVGLREMGYQHLATKACLTTAPNQNLKETPLGGDKKIYDLEDYLILPIQRIPRYVMLLKVKLPLFGITFSNWGLRSP